MTNDLGPGADDAEPAGRDETEKQSVSIAKIVTIPQPRRRLEDRRLAETFDIEHVGLRYKATIGRFADGSLAEIFVSNHKAGNASDVAARDAGILLSLCLQHGCSVETISRALSRNRDGSASGVIGAVLDKITGGGGL